MHALGIGPKKPSFTNFYYVQGANYGTPIPIVYGQNRVAPTMIHLPLPPTKPTGGKGKSTKAGQNYIAPVVFGICEGPIGGIGYVWADKDQPADFATGVIQQQADEGDHVPASGPYTIIVGAVGGSGTFLADINVYDDTSGAWLTRIPDNASPSPAPGQYQLDGTLNGKYYFNAAQASHLVVINYFYGTTVLNGFPGSWVLKLGTTPAQAAWAFLTTNFPAQAVGYPGIAYLAHPAANFPNSNAQQFSYEVKGLAQFGGGIVDANGADMLTDFLTNALHGANLPASQLGPLSGFAASYYNYCAALGLFCSPVIKDAQPARDHLNELFEVTNSGPFWSEGLLKVVPFGDTPATGNGFTFTPNTTPLYALTDFDFLPNRSVPSGASDAGPSQRNAELDPVLVTRRDPTTIYNQVKVEYINRVFDYNGDFKVAEDQVSEALNGPLPAPSMTLHSITTAAVAQQVAQLRLQREQHVTPTSYKFVLGFKYSLLEPMDLVEITDLAQGLDATPVRIMAIEEMENEEGFMITAEPWPFGAATAVAYPSAIGNGGRPNTNSQPGSTLDAFIIEGPRPLISSAMELWIGASGGPQWGGCDVWISTDNVNFQQVGRITGTAAFGTMQPSGLATSASQFPTVDAVNTATVTLLSGRQLITLSTSDFAQLTYPCVITDGVTPEWMAYEVAALVSGSEYDLSTLYRGLYGTAPAAHANTDEFMLIDDAVTKIPWPNGVQGTTVYFKLPAFNLYGSQLEDLASVSSFSYVIGGAPLALTTPVPTITVTIATNDSLTVTTAKASAIVSAPPGATSIKWLASTSSPPTPAAVIAGGTVVSAGAPFFSIPDLGVALAFDDTVYVTAVYYTAGGAQTAVQGHATRPNLLATKTSAIAAGNVQPLTGAGYGPLNATYRIDATTGALTVNNGGLVSSANQDHFTCPLLVPAGCTIKTLTITATSTSGTTGFVTASVRNIGNTAGFGFSITPGGGTQTQSLTPVTPPVVASGDSWYFEVIFVGGSAASGLSFLDAVVTYTMPNPTAAL